jgi:hypothetical protein
VLTPSAEKNPARDADQFERIAETCVRLSLKQKRLPAHATIGLVGKNVGATGFEPTPKTESNETPPAGTTEGHSSTRSCPSRSEGHPGSAHGSPGTGFARLIRHRLLPASAHHPYQACTGLYSGASWEQIGNSIGNVGHAATMRKHQGGDVRALDSQTLSTAATCFQCHGYGRRPGLKIRLVSQQLDRLPGQVSVQSHGMFGRHERG